MRKVIRAQQVKARPVPMMGWLALHWLGSDPPPDHRQYCQKKEIGGIVKYWERNVFAIMEEPVWVPDELDVLGMILAPEKLSPLQEILGNENHN